MGYYGSIDEVAARWAPGRTFEPAMDAERRDTLRARWTKALERSKAWIEA